MQAQPKATLNVAEAAAVIGISKPLVYDLIRNKYANGFPAIKLSERRIVIPYTALMDWLNAKAKETI